ncbi:EAL domain-containing protein [Hyphomicrobium sp. D-2]|uniref:bifunctional diguanylate cyclase/phosphodiesterase n=1 Tax=Hyphomicrobium sp. D-2 TaxID=3041621 RepID=UPI0024540145|nr:EAL domain-containing protein [Hyphomicrobium sp. D-2]MDH4981792.1 EAL domain-containing protein [Hyphomicrobium sp. D-2]
MFEILGCVAFQHNAWLVAAAAVICCAGSWVTAHLFERTLATVGTQRIGWYFLTALTAGVAIWCTHFVAMLGYEANAPVEFDPALTLASLLIAVFGATLGFLIAGSKLTRLAPIVGGGVVGLAIVVMHYTGMMAYRVQGVVAWNQTYLIASIILAVSLSAAALHYGVRRTKHSGNIMAALLALGIVALHFTGMTAFKVEPLMLPNAATNSAAFSSLALAITCMAALIVGTGLTSFLIDGSARAESGEALRNMSNGLLMVDKNLLIRLYNDRLMELLDISPEDVAVGMPLGQFLQLVGTRTGMDAVRTQRIIDNHNQWIAQNGITRVEHHFDDGTIVSIACRPMAGGGAILTYDDVTEAREGQKKIEHMAFHDMLTGLPNRVCFNKRLDGDLRTARDKDGRFALIAIDLNGFKEINDIRGHSAGDRVLVALGQRMEAVLGETDFVGRIGGDEFAVLHRIVSEVSLVDLLGRLEKELFKPITVESNEILPGASIGVAIYPDHASNVPDLVSNADLAMYRAKHDVVRSVCFYDASMDEMVRARRNLASDLRLAIERNELTIYYQVQTSVHTGDITGYEALLRWKHPERGFIPPSEFIPLAEENGLILQIGEWVLHEACRTAAGWEPPYKVAVNLSAVQLAHGGLPGYIMQVLLETGLQPERLELELTESAILSDKERSLHVLRQIKNLGINIALDDFGTGYSSLDTLRTFPFDKIKLDRSFMLDVEGNPQAKAIIRAVLALGKSLNIPVLAEGIETSDQMTILTVEGCDEAQGYLLGRPAPLDHLLKSGQITLLDLKNYEALAAAGRQMRSQITPTSDEIGTPESTLKAAAGR